MVHSNNRSLDLCSGAASGFSGCVLNETSVLVWAMLTAPHSRRRDVNSVIQCSFMSLHINSVFATACLEVVCGILGKERAGAGRGRKAGEGEDAKRHLRYNATV